MRYDTENNSFICRFCGKEYENCMRLSAVHEQFCGGHDHLEVQEA